MNYRAKIFAYQRTHRDIRDLVKEGARDLLFSSKIQTFFSITFPSWYILKTLIVLEEEEEEEHKTEFISVCGKQNTQSSPPSECAMLHWKRWNLHGFGIYVSSEFDLSAEYAIHISFMYDVLVSTGLSMHTIPNHFEPITDRSVANFFFFLFEGELMIAIFCGLVFFLADRNWMPAQCGRPRWPNPADLSLANLFCTSWILGSVEVLPNS